MKTARAFTIVELLIVIVVIGILAAITLVAYNGVQNRARTASVSSGLNQVAKKIALQQAENPGAYPADKTALLALGITETGSLSYQYSVNNTANPATYCVTATDGNVSYYLNNTTTLTPTSGGCAGHGVGGVGAVTNLAMNPAATSTVSSEWLSRYGMSTSWVTGAGDGPTAGLNTYMRQTQPSLVAGQGRGIDHRGNVDLVTPPAGLLWPVTAGIPVTISSYVRASVANTLARLVYRIHNGSGTWLTSTVAGSNTNYTAATWIRLSHTFTPTVSGYLYASSRFEQNVSWPAGATIDGTGLMIVQGSSLTSYADGNSPDWVWNGTPNNSTSTGPPF